MVNEPAKLTNWQEVIKISSAIASKYIIVSTFS